MKMWEKPASDKVVEYTVSGISASIKRLMEGNFPYVKVRGEVSGAKHAPSGHLYFSLKDDQAVLAAICWKGVALQYRSLLEEGLEVVCSGRVTVYAGQSRYQLVVEHVEVAGKGALMALLEKRKQQLASEGLFDPQRKKPIPFLPQTIGIITSPTGAVIRDMVHRIRERFPRHILLWPVPVQGESAAGLITKAIKGFNAIDGKGDIPRPDVLIVARGGGSIEDLWPFNEENVVRAAAASAIPLISAVGHETDITLIDYAADKRAPTPTAAAEFAVPVKEQLQLRVIGLVQRIPKAWYRLMQERTQRLKGLLRGLPAMKRWLEEYTQRMDYSTMRLGKALPLLIRIKGHVLSTAAARLPVPRYPVRLGEGRLHASVAAMHKAYSTLVSRKEQDIVMAGKLMESFHYEKVLQRGYAIIRDGRKKVMTSVTEAVAGKNLWVEWKDGQCQVVVKADKGSKHKDNDTKEGLVQMALFEEDIV